MFLESLIYTKNNVLRLISQNAEDMKSNNLHNKTSTTIKQTNK